MSKHKTIKSEENDVREKERKLRELCARLQKENVEEQEKEGEE